MMHYQQGAGWDVLMVHGLYSLLCSGTFLPMKHFRL